MKKDYYTLSVRAEWSVSCGSDADVICVDLAVTEWQGDILFDQSEVPGCPNMESVGSIKAHFVPVMSLADSVDLFEVFDAHSQELYEAYEVLFDGNEPNPGLRELVDDNMPMMGDVLYLDKMQIAEEHRRFGISLPLMRKFIAEVTGYSPDVWVIGKAGPLNASDLSEAERKRACKALAKHWGRIGFKSVGDPANHIVKHTSWA